MHGFHCRRYLCITNLGLGLLSLSWTKSTIVVQRPYCIFIKAVSCSLTLKDICNCSNIKHMLLSLRKLSVTQNNRPSNLVCDSLFQRTIGLYCNSLFQRTIGLYCNSLFQRTIGLYCNSLFQRTIGLYYNSLFQRTIGLYCNSLFQRTIGLYYNSLFQRTIGLYCNSLFQRTIGLHFNFDTYSNFPIMTA